MSDLQPGDPRRLGSYDLTERLGEGGQGVVYLGVDPSGAKAALKLLRADLAADDQARHRFVRESQAAMQVARFCTAQVLEADVAGDQPWIASEYVPGPSLYKQITEQGPISGAGLERLAIGTATALVAIHQAGIVHRDFKPHNVIMAPDGPRVIDFGIARALDAGQTNATKAIGTPSYMAPEQVAGERLTEAVDVWAWASTMVFAATGRPPFGDDTVVAVINRVMNEAPSLEGIPQELHGLIAACLVKDPARRPTAQQLMMALIGSGPGGTGVPAVGGMPGATALDDPAQATALLAGGAAAAAGGAASTRMAPAGAYDQGYDQGYGRTQGAGGATLPPAAGYEDAYRGRGPAGRGNWEPEKKSRGPVIAAVVAILVLAAVVGIAVANMGGGSGGGANTPNSDQSTSQSESPSDNQTTDSSEPTNPEPTHTRTHRPTHTPTSEQPTQPTDSPTGGPTGGPTQPTHKPTHTPSSPPATGGNGGGGGSGGGGGTGAGGLNPMGN